MLGVLGFGARSSRCTLCRVPTRIRVCRSVRNQRFPHGDGQFLAHDLQLEVPLGLGLTVHAALAGQEVLAVRTPISGGAAGRTTAAARLLGPAAAEAVAGVAGVGHGRNEVLVDLSAELQSHERKADGWVNLQLGPSVIRLFEAGLFSIKLVAKILSYFCHSIPLDRSVP